MIHVWWLCVAYPPSSVIQELCCPQTESPPWGDSLRHCHRSTGSHSRGPYHHNTSPIIKKNTAALALLSAHTGMHSSTQTHAQAQGHRETQAHTHIHTQHNACLWAVCILQWSRMRGKVLDHRLASVPLCLCMVCLALS